MIGAACIMYMCSKNLNAALLAGSPSEWLIEALSCVLLMSLLKSSEALSTHDNPALCAHISLVWAGDQSGLTQQ